MAEVKVVYPKYIVSSSDLEPLLDKLGLQLSPPSGDPDDTFAEVPRLDLAQVLEALLVRIKRLEERHG